MAGSKTHQYHIVNPSIWPLIGAISALAFFAGLVLWMHDNPAGPYVVGAGTIGIAFTMFSWWADVIREAHGGDHTPIVQLHLRYGMILFIASEVMFFVAWFWAFFSSALFPAEVAAVGGVWPPEGYARARSVRLAAAQHPDPALLGLHRHLGAPRADPRPSRRADQGPVVHDRARPAVHRHPGL